jgi:hypothetical protein
MLLLLLCSPSLSLSLLNVAGALKESASHAVRVRALTPSMTNQTKDHPRGDRTHPDYQVTNIKTPNYHI